MSLIIGDNVILIRVIILIILIIHYSTIIIMTILWITVSMYAIGTRVLIVMVLTKNCMVIDVIIAGIDPIMCIHHITLPDTPGTVPLITITTTMLSIR